MPILLYATDVCPLSQSDIRSLELDFAMFRFLMKLFKTNDKYIIKRTVALFCFKFPSELIQNRKTSFDSRYCNLRSYSEMLATQA